MAEKFKNKYRIQSSRLQNWDYASNGYYFVTICTQNRVNYFGNIINGKIKLSQIGEIAYKYWMEIPMHFQFIKLDEFIIMPDHIHGIIQINKSVQKPKLGVSSDNSDNSLQTPKLGISSDNPNNPDNSIKYWKPGNLGVIINQYKRICTINARKINSEFTWQPRYHDRIIRNNHALNTIRNYIKNNPLN